MRAHRSFDPDQGTVSDATLILPVPEQLLTKSISIRTRSVPAIARIAAQEAIFVDGCFDDAEDWWSRVFLSTVLDFVSRKWCFVRQDVP